MHDVPAVLPRARPDVDDVVRRADRLLVVLDDDDGVPQIPQPLQRRDQALVVALVQADGRLVEDVQDADQAAADLAGQADALRLAARERPCRARQRQVVEPDVEEELHALAHFLEHPVGDHVLAVGELELGHGVDGALDREAAQLVDVAPVHRHGQRLGLEPRPVTLGAGHLAHVLLDLLTRPVGLRFAVAPLQPRDDALEVRVVRARAVEPVLVGDPHGPVARAVEDELLVLRLQLLPGRVEVEATELGHPRLQAHEVLAARPGPRRQRALGQRQGVVGHHELGVDLEAGAQPGAQGARAVGRVEGEVARRRLLETQPAVRAGEMLREGDRLVALAALGPVHDEHLGGPAGERERGLDRLGQPLADVGPADQAVDHHLDGVGLVPRQRHLGPVRQLQRHAVDAHPGETLLGQVVEQRAVLALAPPHDRRHDLEAGPLGQLEHPVDDLLGRLAGDRPAAVGAVRVPDAGVEEPQVVVDLGDGPDRRARVAAGRLLVDGDGRRQALDEVDVGLVHLAQELAGVGRQRFDIAALALGVDRVEGERRLARPRQPGEDDQLVPGQVEADVAQIVLAGPANDQTVGHPGRIPARLSQSRRGPGQAAAPVRGRTEAAASLGQPPAIPTTGLLRTMPPAEPAKGASP